MSAPERLYPGTREWGLYHVEHEQRYRFAAPYCEGKVVLDAACGVGYGSRILAESGAKRVLSVDISESAIQYAQEHFSHPDIDFVCASIEGLERLNTRFDVVVSFETIEHLPEPKSLLEQCKSVLAPGGTMICSTPNTEFGAKGSTQNPYHLSEMTYTQFEELFSDYFTVNERYHQSHSANYARHIQLVRQMEQLEKVVRSSKGLAIENWIRRIWGRYVLPQDMTPLATCNAGPGDYIIEPIEQGDPSHLTFIFVGANRVRSGLRETPFEAEPVAVENAHQEPAEALL